MYSLITGVGSEVQYERKLVLKRLGFHTNINYDNSLLR